MQGKRVGEWRWTREKENVSMYYAVCLPVLCGAPPFPIGQAVSPIEKTPPHPHTHMSHGFFQRLQEMDTTLDTTFSQIDTIPGTCSTNSTHYFKASDWLNYSRLQHFLAGRHLQQPQPLPVELPHESTGELRRRQQAW